MPINFKSKAERRAYHKAYYKTNKDRIKELHAIWRSDNKDYKKQYDAKYRLSLAGKWTVFKSYKGGTLSKDDFMDILSDGKCHYCRLSIVGGSYSLDRKDNKRGYSKKNVVPCCKFCNYAKYTLFTYEQMKKFIGPAIREARLFAEGKTIL